VYVYQPIFYPTKKLRSTDDEILAMVRSAGVMPYLLYSTVDLAKKGVELIDHVAEFRRNTGFTAELRWKEIGGWMWRANVPIGFLTVERIEVHTSIE